MANETAVVIDHERVRALRQQRVYGQTELARLAGVTRETVAKIESGDRQRVYPSTVRKLAEALGVEPVHLIRSGDHASV